MVLYRNFIVGACHYIFTAIGLDLVTDAVLTLIEGIDGWYASLGTIGVLGVIILAF